MAQNVNDPVPFPLLDVKPTFNGGGIEEFSKWINARLIYPEEAKKQNIQGRVIVHFIVEPDGNVSNVMLLKKAHPLLDKEAVRLVSSAPCWTPGYMDGKAVRVAFRMPLIFMIAGTQADPSSGTGATSETPSQDEQGTIPVQLADTKPSFQGGNSNQFSIWVNSHLIYPDKAKEEGIQGRVILEFTVETDGRVTNVKAINDAHPLLSAEAIRVVSMSPDWIPGMKNGRPVSVLYTFPVEFCLGLPGGKSR